jgi:hypothetical protein
MKHFKILALLPLLVALNGKRSTPIFIFPKEQAPEFVEATRLINTYGNSDELFKFMREKRTYYSQTDMTAYAALDKFREDMERDTSIEIKVMPDKKEYEGFVGGWLKGAVWINLDWEQSVEQRAGTIYHEMTHKYGWRHNGNDHKTEGNLESFPYAVAEDFQIFLKAKKQKVVETKKK